jgi:hypothetical protein
MERGCCATLFRNPLQDPLYVKAKPCTVTHSACENAALCTWCRASCRAAHGFATTPGSSFIPFIDVFVNFLGHSVVLVYIKTHKASSLEH